MNPFQLNPERQYAVSEGAMSLLLDKIFNERGWDFRGYKRTSLARRLAKRLQTCRVSSLSEYLAVLDADSAEYSRLFSTMTIKVSEFFREPEVFMELKSYIPELLAGAPVKAWCCGCAYGEEPYSVAMLLSECLEPGLLMASRVFATDIDNEALEQARRAMYREEVLRNLPADLRERYVFECEGMHKVKYNIRNMVKFGTLDIVRSPSIVGVNLLFCRNLFIYFNKPLQEAVFQKLDYALKPGGLLVLGKAEVLPQQFQGSYSPLGHSLNIYQKRSR